MIESKIAHRSSNRHWNDQNMPRVNGRFAIEMHDQNIPWVNGRFDLHVYFLP